MAIQFSTAVRNAHLDAVETAVGTGPQFKIRSGSVPASCATADSGTVLISGTLPSDWLSNAVGGSKSDPGTWTGSASNAGTAGHFRIYDSAGTTCHIQGTVGVSGADLIVDDVAVGAFDNITITFTLQAPNS